MIIKDIHQLQSMKLGKNATNLIQSKLVSTTTTKQNKYRNQKTTRIIDKKTVVIDSLKEANYYDTLFLQEKAGLIQDLKTQPEFELIPQIKHGDTVLRKIKYVADFSYTKNGKKYVVDVKGLRTDVYKIKKRLFLLKYPNLVLVEI